MDIRVFIRRAILLSGIYVLLLLVTIPGIIFIHNRFILPSSSQSYLVAEIVLTGLLLSSGPFLYALFLRRSKYFHEHTVAGLAHELKSPLAGIESALEILSVMAPKNPKDFKEKEYLEMIERNSVRLRRFVEDLLHSFSFNGGKVVLERDTWKSDFLIGSVIDDYRNDVEAKGLRLLVDIGAEPATIAVDRQKFKQILSNVISNAVKFTSDGSITVTTKKEGATVLISVVDTGRGISSKDLPHIFDQFYRGGNAGTSHGSGIGLTIAKAWVEAHGGKIWAESDGEGKGTTVRFTIPV